MNGIEAMLFKKIMDADDNIKRIEDDMKATGDVDKTIYLEAIARARDDKQVATNYLKQITKRDIEK